MFRVFDDSWKDIDHRHINQVSNSILYDMEKRHETLKHDGSVRFKFSMFNRPICLVQNCLGLG